LPFICLGLLEFVCSALKEKKDDRYSWARQGGLLATIPFLMAVPPILGVVVGRFLDNRFNTNPILTIVFLILGFAASVREVANVLKRADEGSDDDQGDGHRKS